MYNYTPSLCINDIVEIKSKTSKLKGKIGTIIRYCDSEVFRKPIAFSCGLETQANGQLLSNCQTNELQSLVGDGRYPNICTVSVGGKNINYFDTSLELVVK